MASPFDPDPDIAERGPVAQDWCEERGLGRLPRALAIRVMDSGRAETPCESCGTYEGIRKVMAMTAYHEESPWDQIDGPNRDLWFCEECAEVYRDNWTAMWDEYYASRG